MALPGRSASPQAEKATTIATPTSRRGQPRGTHLAHKDHSHGQPSRWRLMKRIATVLGILLGSYLIVRAIAEPFVIDMSDPVTYRDDWGGPSLAGVLAVHMGPGLIAATVMSWALARRVRLRHDHTHGDPDQRNGQEHGATDAEGVARRPPPGLSDRHVDEHTS